VIHCNGGPSPEDVAQAILVVCLNDDFLWGKFYTPSEWLERLSDFLPKNYTVDTVKAALNQLADKHEAIKTTRDNEEKYSIIHLENALFLYMRPTNSNN